MDPVVYDFAINHRGTVASLLSGDEAFLPPDRRGKAQPLRAVKEASPEPTAAAPEEAAPEEAAPEEEAA